MEVKDNKNEQPLRHYRGLLSDLDPAAVSARTGIPYEGGAFRTRLLGRAVRLEFPAGEAYYEETGRSLRPNALILLLRLLVGGTLAPATGKLLSYAELPWGETYLSQFRGRCIQRLAFSFGNEPEKFAEACRSLGVGWLTLYAFSTENWKRPRAEVEALMALLSICTVASACSVPTTAAQASCQIASYCPSRITENRLL